MWPCAPLYRPLCTHPCTCRFLFWPYTGTTQSQFMAHDPNPSHSPQNA